MKFGLEQHIIDNLIAVFEQHSKVDKAFVFGSRAKGNYRPDSACALADRSDIDIAVKGQDLHTDDIIAMCVAFEEKGITHKIDLINYDTINDLSAKAQAEPDLKDHIDRLGIEVYSRWKECKLGDYIETINGFAFKSTDFLDSEKPNSLPIIKIKNVANGDVNIDGVHYHLYSDNLKKYVVEKGDILISLTGNHPELETQVVGLVSRYKLETKALLNQRVGKLFSKKPKEFNDDYLYYFLKNKDTHQYLASQSSGSANQANISKTDIEKISFSKPPLQEQTTIANILSSLDDKIDLLHRQNKTLEQLAETLFKLWFVEEAEESWEVVKLEKLGKIICGKTPSKKISAYFNGEYPFIKIPDMHGNTFVFDSIDSLTETGLNSQGNKTIPPKSICVSCIATVGLVVLNAKTSQTNQQINSIIPEKDIYRYFIYLKMLSIKDDLLAMASGGTATDNLNTGDFSKIDIQLPTNVKLNEFHEKATPLFEKIYTNQTQIRTLTKTRDTLLPKLMSGEIRVDF